MISYRILPLLSLILLASCGDGQSKTTGSDSVAQTSDTASSREQIPGTPGLSGSDSTRPAGNDSIRQAGSSGAQREGRDSSGRVGSSSAQRVRTDTTRPDSAGKKRRK